MGRLQVYTNTYKNIIILYRYQHTLVYIIYRIKYRLSTIGSGEKWLSNNTTLYYSFCCKENDVDRRRKNWRTIVREMRILYEAITSMGTGVFQRTDAIRLMERNNINVQIRIIIIIKRIPPIHRQCRNVFQWFNIIQQILDNSMLT